MTACRTQGHYIEIQAEIHIHTKAAWTFSVRPFSGSVNVWRQPVTQQLFLPAAGRRTAR